MMILKNQKIMTSKTPGRKVRKLAIMQIVSSKRSSKLAGCCDVKHHGLAAIQMVAMPSSTTSRQGQVRYLAAAADTM